MSLSPLRSKQCASIPSARRTNRLTDAAVGSTTATYGYNHLNQRVTKTLNGHTRLLVYDQAGNLISELDGTTGAVLAEYIWLDGNCARH